MSDPFAQTLFAPQAPPAPAAPVSSEAGPITGPSLAERDTLDGPGDRAFPISAPPSDVPAIPSLAPPSAERRIGGRYEIVSLLGAGGMGNVYRARDHELGDMVALKMLRPEIISNPAALERFRLEVKLARRVTHANVARMFDIGEDGGERYLTMELVDGEPLAAALRREGRVSPERAASIACGVCEGLAAAHAAGVIHRDLKPDNVLLARDGRAVVTDFGIAQAAGADSARVTPGVVGTPAYMAPEQVEGKAAGPSADLYALGVMLFEMVTGELPWTGDSVFAVAAARLLRPPPDPLAVRRDLPPDLAAAIRTLMARAPAERYPSAEAARDALRAVVDRPPAPSACAPSDCAPGLAFPALCKCKKQVAVLPLRNAGPAEDDYIAAGLTEDLIDQLSMAEDVRVRSRGMVARYCHGDRDPREVGRELDVQVVVDGTVRRTPAGVRVAVRLISVADGVQIWHRRFDRRPEDLLSVSDDAAQAIAEALAAPLAAPQRPSASAEAIELYLRARALYIRFFADDSGEALKLFERALALAPDDPRILAGYAMETARRRQRDASAGAMAREAAERAVARAPNLAESHVAFGVVCYQEQREPEAVRALKRALVLSRANVEAHDLLGRILAETRLLDEACVHLETALAAEPDAELARATLARTFALRGEVDKVLSIMLSHDPAEPGMLAIIARYCLWSRDVERARAALADMKVRGLKTVLAATMIRVVAERHTPWDELPPPGAPGPPEMSRRFRAFRAQISAEVAAYLGDSERALAYIEVAAAVGVFDLAWLDRCPLFGDLREHARFIAARRPIQARAAAIEAAYREPITRLG